ncbi:MAG: hypothetical protein A2451_14880 [Bdellovibrionales bacterium RIFOXYC2_FULL_39_8]|nr:MAG: hypothetical protein A2485_06230 [Bdellovibrionales bacterium RIFOXYC12_FULL_39_17]OFZ73738.1 MAG: hypothetical protein A2451_14880 [Bdellovibrionales bacterium RIFOXYC2_FULL_39_8]
MVAASTSSAIDTISEVDLISGANLLLDYQTNVLASNISSLDDATTYYFALVVKDMAGNQALYPIVSVTTLAIATFNGWTHLRAVGAKNPIAFTGLATSPATVMVQFAAVTLTAGTVESYNIYRGTSPGQNFSSAYATGISASARTYIDNGAFSAGNIYYYSVAPVVGGVAIPPEDITDQEIKVTIPPENMVLVHRWIGNREMCELMGKAIDRSNNYRCIHTGTGSDGAFFDLGQSLLVDAYELGCNFSENGCSGGVCLGTTTPGTATINSVYYQRGSSSDTCYINTNGASSWLSIDDAANATQRATMASARPGLPPIAMISPVSANLICNAQSEVGFSGSKRLLHRREWLVAAAWDSTLSDATITTIESGTASLPVNGHCNSNYATGVSFDNRLTPTNLETLPSTSSSGVKILITGGVLTRNCLSRYGAQDMVGNIAEWNSDQINNGVGVTASSNNVDNTNADFNNGGALVLQFDNDQAPVLDNSFDSTFSGIRTLKRMQLPIGTPVGSDTFAEDGIVDWTAATAKYHGDKFWVNTSALRDVVSGGYYIYGTTAGRFTMQIEAAYYNVAPYIGIRCVLPLAE